MTQPTQIETHPDGSINYAFYTQKGRTLRSISSHKNLASFARFFRTMGVSMIAHIKHPVPNTTNKPRIMPAE